MFEYIVNNTLPSVTVSCETLRSKMNNQSAHIVVYFGSGNSHLMEEWEHGKKTDPSMTEWLRNFDINCANSFNASYESVVVIRPERYEQRIAVHDPYYNVYEWVKKHYHPDVFPIDWQHSIPIFKHQMDTIVLLMQPNQTDEPFFKNYALTAARVNNVLFAYSDGTNNLHDWVTQNLGDREIQYPSLFGYSPRGQFEPKYFVPDSWSEF